MLMAFDIPFLETGLNIITQNKSGLLSGNNKFAVGKYS